MRANQLGAPFTVKGVRYLLTFDFNKLCELEDIGLDLLNGKTDAAKLQSPTFIRQLFFDGCTTEDGEPLKDLAAAGKLISALGLLAAVNLIGDALGSVAQADGEGSEAAENPLEAQTPQ